MYQVSNHLGVRLRRKLIALRHELRFQRLVVLVDAVVNYGDAGARNMRMRVGFSYTAMGRPTCVCKTQLARLRMRGEFLLELRNLANGLLAFQLAFAVEYGDPRGFVTPILKALQTLDEDRDDITLRDSSDNSTHYLISRRALPELARRAGKDTNFPTPARLAHRPRR